MSAMASRHVLLLAGSTEASELARRLADLPGVDVTVSFAGRTAVPAPQPPGVAVRTGGFGGIEGLREHLEMVGFDAVIDATHPFAKQMPLHACAACAAAGVPVIRVERAPWTEQPGDAWIEASDVHEAAALVARSSFRRVLLTIGRQELAPFAACTDRRLFVRSIDPPTAGTLDGATLLLARGPFTVDDEIALLGEIDADVVVSKNSGGEATSAKVTAARLLGIPIVMVNRPPATGATTVDTPAKAIEWLLGQPLRSRS